MSAARTKLDATTRVRTNASRSPIGRAKRWTNPKEAAPGRPRSKRPIHEPKPKRATAAISERRGRARGDTKPREGTPAPDARNLIGLVKFWEEQQRHRIRMGNQIWAIEDAGGVVPPEMKIAHEHMLKIEEDLGKPVVREWRKHPLARWQAGVRGLGEHSCAVLVAMLDGDPYIAYPKRQITNAEAKSLGLEIPLRRDGSEMKRWTISAGDPFARSVSQLWAFCGVGKPARRAEGMSQADVLSLGKPLIKSRLWQVSAHFSQSKNPEYRAVYLAARAKVADRVHETECKPCGSTGKVGLPWGKKHVDFYARRIVAKQFLVDLWLEAKRIHEERVGGHAPNDAQRRRAPDPHQDQASA